MRYVICVSVLMLAAATVVAQDDQDAGDIASYDPLVPPEIIPSDVYPEEVEQKTFILVEGALLVPDAVIIVEMRVPQLFEVVDQDELDRYEPVIELRLNGFLDLSKLNEPSDEAILRFEQRMWRNGLRLALRTYAESRESNVRYTAFRVEFSSTGHFYRAALTLYREKGAEQQVLGQLRDLIKAVGNVRQAVEATGDRINASVDAVRGSVAGVSGEIDSLEGKIASVEGKVSATDGKISSLDSKVSAADSKVSSLDGSIGSLRGSISSLEGRVSSLESK